MWNFNYEGWTISNKWLYTYDTQNNMIEELCQEKNELNEWENSEKMSYTYDENNNVNLGIYQEWENNTWIDAIGYLNLHYNSLKSIWKYYDLFKFSATYIKTGSNFVQEHRIESVINLYPNPTTGELQVTSYELQVTNIEVFDIYGRKQKAESRKQKGNSPPFMEAWQPQADGVVIDISELQAGIYFVKISTGAGAVVKKVVKQ
jgi:hypothetical protein